MDIKNVQNQKVKILFQTQKPLFFSTRVGNFFGQYFSKISQFSYMHVEKKWVFFKYLGLYILKYLFKHLKI